MTNKYSRGKIYKLICDDPQLVYYGSTICTLNERLRIHRKHYKQYKEDKHHYITSCKLFDIGNVKIELVESVKCNSIQELLDKERYYIQSNVCVNRYVPNRTKKQYFEDNRNSIVEKKNQKYECECGGKYTHSNRVCHFKTNKHQEYIKNSTKTD